MHLRLGHYHSVHNLTLQGKMTSSTSMSLGRNENIDKPETQHEINTTEVHRILCHYDQQIAYLHL